MELKKMQNLTEHRDEIYSRPKKEWFMSEKQKKRIKDEAKKEAGITEVPKKKKIMKGRQKKRRNGK